MKHQFQHPDSPTWCLNCGTFDTHCIPDEECWAEPTGKYDSSKPENLKNFMWWRVLQHEFTDSVIEDLANFELGGEG